MTQETDKKSFKEPQINLSSVPPSLAIDGSGVRVTNGYADIVFFQIMEKDSKKINARGVSNVRMNLSQLKGLQSTIVQVIKDLEKQSADNK